VKLDQDKLIWLGIGVFIGIVVGVGSLVLANRARPAPIVIVPPEPTPTPQATATPGPIRVFVNGQVAAPAVYELPPQSIVEQAVEAAGGFTAEANTAMVNLAQALNDGAQVYIPALDEVVDGPVTVVRDAASSTTSSDDASGGTTGAGQPININTATAAELDELPGIGPSTAQKILDHRNENGPFATIEAIMDVSGIGEAKFDQIRELITVEGE
jgi:competence protein ComEA